MKFRQLIKIDKQGGVSLLELLAALVVMSILIMALDSIVKLALDSRDATHQHNQLHEQAQFAMQRMTMASNNTSQLLLPLEDNLNTNWPENIREQTFPASLPIGSSTFATAVLAVSLPRYSDLNGDGIPDADDDKDGKIDEDLPADKYNDSAPGIFLIDDDGDGSIDEGGDNTNDDEDALANEDGLTNKDNDKDGSVGEDPGSDNNDDGCSGYCGIDDDGDSSIDESTNANNDEDAVTGEDWINAVVFYLNNGALIERTPVPWDISSGTVDGRDFVETIIAENVSLFRIERSSKGVSGKVLVDITLKLTSTNGDSVELNTNIRVGGAL